MSHGRAIAVAVLILGLGAVRDSDGLTLAAQGQTQQTVAAPAADNWSGQISLPTGRLAIAVTLTRDDRAVWTGAIDIPAQGVKGFPLGAIVVDDRAVSFVIVNVPGQPTFKGAIAADGAHLSGTFSQNGATWQQATALFQAASDPWLRFFLAYDPGPTLARVHCPVLAIAGENDVQVPARENIPAIRSALEASGNRDVTVVSLPHLNHMLQTSVTGLPDEYGTIDETIAPVVLQLVGDWIQKHV